MRRAIHTRQIRARQGAVMVEAVMVVSALCLMYLGLTFAHRSTHARIAAQQAARAQAWSQAMNGCSEQRVSLREMASGLLRGDLPVPPAIFGVSNSTGNASRSVAHLRRDGQRSVGHSIAVPCNTRSADHADDGAGNWLLDLLQQ